MNNRSKICHLTAKMFPTFWPQYMLVINIKLGYSFSYRWCSTYPQAGFHPKDVILVSHLDAALDKIINPINK